MNSAPQCATMNSAPQCTICLEPLLASDDCILTCSHRFHASCVKELRKAGVEEVCPLCRAELPPTADKLFADGMSLRFPIAKRIESWTALDRRQQRRMEEGQRLWEAAAELGHANAQYRLGVIFLNGQGITKSFGKAFEWFEKAAANRRQRFEKAAVDQIQPHARAQCNLGFMHARGQGVQQSFFAANEYFLKAAEQGDAESQYVLGINTEDGRGVEQSTAAAKEWFAKAAEQGHGGALLSLGIMYDEGNGVMQDYSKAREWYEKAAAEGIPLAMCMIGVLYEYGQGVPRNDSLAMQWYGRAAARGDGQAKQRCAVILKRARREQQRNVIRAKGAWK